MKLLQTEFKSVKDDKPEEAKDYILTDGTYFAVGCFMRGFWYPSNIEAMSGYAELEFEFQPTHFAEIKTGETK